MEHHTSHTRTANQPTRTPPQTPDGTINHPQPPPLRVVHPVSASHGPARGSAREFALRLTSPVSAVLSAFAGPFGGAVLAGPFSRRSALPGDGQVDLQFSRKTREEAERRKDEDVWPVFFHTEDADE